MVLGPCIDFTTMPPGSLGRTYREIFGIDGNYEIIINASTDLNIEEPTPDFNGLRIASPEMIVRIQIIDPDNPDLPNKIEKVNFEILYGHPGGRSNSSISWQVYDSQNNLLRTSPPSPPPSTVNRQKLVVRTKGDVRRLVFSASVGEPDLLALCCYP